MSKAKPPQHREDLSAAHIARGMNAARRNARRLSDDARSLLEIDRYPSATALAILSIEESGKVSILRGLALAPDEEHRQQLWNDFKHHRSKNVAWIIPRLVIQVARTLESLRLAADRSAEHTEFLEEVKQKALYADFDSNFFWNEPQDLIDEAFAGYLVNTAESLASGEAVTEREIELWIEYMSPTYGAPLEHQKISLSKWYAAMRQEGLWEAGRVSLESFPGELPLGRMINQPRVLRIQEEGVGKRECSPGDTCRPSREFTLRLAGAEPDISYLGSGGSSGRKPRSLLPPTRTRIPMMTSSTRNLTPR